MKIIYGQKDNYIKHIKEDCKDIIDFFKKIGRPDLAEEAYKNMVQQKLEKLNNILENGLDTGTVVKCIEPVIDIAYDAEEYNKGIEYAYHGKCYYFVVKRGKKNVLIHADTALLR